MSVEISNLTYTYPKAGAAILRDLNLNIAQGEVYGLLGPSGCGKSTTQKILMGLLRGAMGEIRLFGQPLAALGREYYERIGVSFELPTLYLRMTARENLQLFAALYARPCMDPLECLALVDLQEAADQRVEAFSKGMKMRLNLCRAVLHDPDLLFLDEPTSGQDPARARITRDLIRSLRDRGKTIFLTTHNMAEAAEICDRVGFLTLGHIPVEGAPDDLMRQYGEASVEVTRRTPRGLEVLEFSRENLAQNAGFLAALEGDLVSIHSKEASLDDVFIRVTSALENAP